MSRVIDVLEMAKRGEENFVEGHSNFAKGGPIHSRFVNGSFVMDGNRIGRGTRAFPQIAGIRKVTIELCFDYGGGLSNEKVNSLPASFGFGLCHEKVSGPSGGMPTFRGPLWAFILPNTDYSGEVFSFDPRVNSETSTQNHGEIPSSFTLGQTLSFSLEVVGRQQTLTTPWGVFQRYFASYPEGCLAFEIQNGGTLTVSQIIAETAMSEIA